MRSVSFSRTMSDASSIAMKKVTIYTDGACSGNPGIGGWGAILMYGSAKKEISGASEMTTNNRMEMMAAINALKMLKEPCEVELFTDSAYLSNGFNQGWILNWLKRGWKKANGDSVENRELWENLLELSRQHKVTWIKVKGHADNEFNNRCDKLARDAVQKLKLRTAN